ncbi:GMC family oxidoreductase N-terminal domain-containing protein [Paenibacillus sp. N4]|uniref:GMC oxidoreductase n=1 Tax=Paenibacillus vietnamensis TaxID=2590547 RepID=UPI001CD17F35|nr:GMC oxidoreductase [Paenibacillus vietnamensis]MCA0756467.1 GMC family oxidoreductase N-terminal domain-containing protein [Paenibacillus vietnamensis]
MRMYVASDRDTLRTIAERYAASVAAVMRMNPGIGDPDRFISGMTVRLPSTPTTADAIADTSDDPTEGGMSAPAIDTAVLPYPVSPPRSRVHADNWIPVIPAGTMAETEYDVLIVGSGAGGGAALWRLGERWVDSEKRIGVIEAGDTLLPTAAANLPMFTECRLRHLWRSPKYLNRYGSFALGQKGAASADPSMFTQFIALGGRTLIWPAVCPRMAPADFAGWPVTSKEMNNYYHLAEQVMKVNSNYARGSALQDTLLGRLRSGGFTEAVDLPMAVDFAETRFGLMHSNVFFSSILFFALTMNRRSVDLAVQTRAVKVLVENNRAAGIEVKSEDGSTHVIRAETIVLAASTIETPRLLLNSGLQGEAIGRYLTNHSCIKASGIVQRADFPEELGTLGIMLPPDERRPYQLTIKGPGSYFWYQDTLKPFRKEWGIEMTGTGYVQSRAENRVTLDPVRKDKYGVPEARIQFAYSEADWDVIERMADGIRRVSLAMNAPFTAENGRPAFYLLSPGADNHDMGTCRMGVDPSTSATNRFGQIHGIDGLFVADASVIPGSGAADPVLTVTALAIRTADYIADLSEASGRR